MMSNLSSIYNTVSRQAESLGKSAAVHTLHSIKSTPLRKNTPGNLLICPAALRTVKYLHSRGQAASILLLVQCLLPSERGATCSPSPAREKLQRHDSYQLCFSTPDLESAVRIPTPLHLDATKLRETPCAADMPYSPLVLSVAQRGSHTCAARIPIPEHKTSSSRGRNNFRPADGQSSLKQSAANHVQARTWNSRQEQCFPPISTATALD